MPLCTPGPNLDAHVQRRDGLRNFEPQVCLAPASVLSAMSAMNSPQPAEEYVT